MKKRLHTVTKSLHAVTRGLTSRLKKAKAMKGLLAFAVVVVLLLAVYLGQQGVEEEEAFRVVQVGDKTIVAVPDAKECVDSDWGFDFYTKGIVVTKALTEEDTCSRSKVYRGRLYEEYCTPEGEHARLNYDCPSGLCEDGACVELRADSVSVTGDAVTNDFSLGSRGRRYWEDAG